VEKCYNYQLVVSPLVTVPSALLPLACAPAYCHKSLHQSCQRFCFWWNSPAFWPFFTIPLRIGEIQPHVIFMANVLHFCIHSSSASTCRRCRPWVWHDMLNQACHWVTTNLWPMVCSECRLLPLTGLFLKKNVAISFRKSEMKMCDCELEAVCDSTVEEDEKPQAIKP